MGRAATLTGVVVDATDAVIPRACVVVFSGEHEWQGKTNAKGTFRFELQPGIYDAEVVARGFLRQIVKTIRIGPTGGTMRVSLNLPNTCSNWSSAAGVSYLNPGHKALTRVPVRAVPNASISISTEYDPADGFLDSRTIAAGRANQKGVFEVSRLSPGLYRFQASRKGYEKFVSSNVRVRPGKLAQIVISMHPEGEICQ